VELGGALDPASHLDGTGGRRSTSPTGWSSGKKQTSVGDVALHLDSAVARDAV
jgi:hypothetical protein